MSGTRSEILIPPTVAARSVKFLLGIPKSAAPIITGALELTITVSPAFRITTGNSTDFVLPNSVTSTGTFTLCEPSPREAQSTFPVTFTGACFADSKKISLRRVLRIGIPVSMLFRSIATSNLPLLSNVPERVLMVAGSTTNWFLMVAKLTEEKFESNV